MMAVFWAVTPLVSAAFNSTRITQTASSIANTSAALAPVADQISALTSGFMMTAYGVVWLGQDLPGYTTNDSALLPFVVGSTDKPTLLDEAWTSTTTMYSTTLACKPAIVENTTTGPTYSNGHGCVTEPGALPSGDGINLTALYIGYYMDQYIEYSLSGMGCSSEEFSHLFLAFWGDTVDGVSKLNALFCEPAYWATKVNATVFAQNMTVSAIVPLETPATLSDDLFNRSDFELVIGTGSQTISRRADIPDTTVLFDQEARLQQMGIGPSANPTNMVGFALGATKLELSQYLDASVLASSFEKAHKLLFALAINSLLSVKALAPDTRPGIIQGVTNTVVVVRMLALVLECVLGAVTLLTLALLYVSWTRSSQIHQDPASLNDVIGMVKPESLASRHVYEGFASGKAVRAYIKEGKINLSAGRSEDKSQVPGDNKKNSFSVTSVRSAGAAVDADASPIQPLELRMVVAIAFIIILLLAVVALITLQTNINRHHGLRLPSGNAVVNRLLTNYIPVVFATFLEPFWLLLNRLLCILKPFDELRKGDARPSKSIRLKYTSLPPQLVILRALHARHFLLAAVCAIGLSANVMSVALSGLFLTKVTVIDSNHNLEQLFLPVIDQSSIDVTNSDPVYIATANISDTTSLPAWTSQERYFLPFALNNTSNSNDDPPMYKAATQGFGVGLECAPIDYNSTEFIMNGTGSILNPTTPVAVPQKLSKGRNITCINANQGPGGGQNNTKAALEVFLPLSVSNVSTGDNSNDICNNLLLAGFIRANISVSANNVKTDNTGNMSEAVPEILAINSIFSLWMVCQPTFLTAPFSVTVDCDGRIQSYTQIGPYVQDLAPFFFNGSNLTSFLEQTRKFWGFSQDTSPYWHNDTFVDTWFAYFVKVLTNTTAFIDPAAPVPDFITIAPVIQHIYARIFAIMLSLHPSWFSNAPPGNLVSGSVLTTSSRIFMSRPAYIITVALLGLNILVALAYYIKRPKRMLKRMPTTIASVLELFDGSGLVGEARARGGVPEEWKLGYGRFVGTDGKPRVGIERRPFVVEWDQR